MYWCIVCVVFVVVQSIIGTGNVVARLSSLFLWRRVLYFPEDCAVAAATLELSLPVTTRKSIEVGQIRMSAAAASHRLAVVTALLVGTRRQLVAVDARSLAFA